MGKFLSGRLRNEAEGANTTFLALLSLLYRVDHALQIKESQGRKGNSAGNNHLSLPIFPSFGSTYLWSTLVTHPPSRTQRQRARATKGLLQGSPFRQSFPMEVRLPSQEGEFVVVFYNHRWCSTVGPAPMVRARVTLHQAPHGQHLGPPVIVFSYICHIALSAVT